MPKMKTNKAAAKRFKVKGGGKVKRGSANRRHLLTKKSRTRKRNLRQDSHVDKSNLKPVKRLLVLA